MQSLPNEENLHEMSKSVFWKNIKKKEKHHQFVICCLCVFRFYGPVGHFKRPVYLTTLSGQAKSSKRLTVLFTFFCQKLTTALID